MKISYKFFIPFILLVSLFGSCADDPNSVGSALIPENDKLSSLVIDSNTESFEQSFSSFQKDSLYFGSSSLFLLGNYKNISSEVLLEFSISLPDSIKLPLDSNKISLTSAWIEMYPAYWIGDSNNFDFTVHEINTSWNSILINQDTINAIHSTLGSNILESLDYAPGDSVLKFSFGTQLVEKWARRTINDSYPDTYGISLSPKSNTGIAGFQGISNYPRYNYPVLFMVFEKPEGFIDTVLAITKIDIHLPTGDRLPDPPNEILLESSLGVRGKLKINLDKVPRNILINRADLELTFDDLNSFQGTIPTDTVAVSFLSDYESAKIKSANGKYPLLKKDGKYIGDIKQFVQRWLDGEDNEGMEVKLSDENRSASAVSFYGSDNPNNSLRPRLTIYYTKK